MASPVRAVGYGLGVGFIFGTALEKAKVYLPDVIRSQMVFEDFTMLKMFLVASGLKV